MCIPFHTPGGAVSRLSRDIDLVRAGAPEVDAAMKRVAEKSPDFEISGKPRKHRMKNLRFYQAKYDSVLGGDGLVTADFMCELDVNFPTKTVTRTSLLGRDVSHRARILTRGGLVGDKLTSLALGGIGLAPERQSAAPKQIHDLGTQLRLSSEADVREALEAFAALTEFKVRKYENDPPYTTGGTLSTITDALLALLEIREGVHLSKLHKGRFGSFAGMYLSRAKPYDVSDHITDVLLALFMAVTAGKYLESADGGLAAEAAQVLKDVRDAGRAGAQDAQARKSATAGLPDALRQHRSLHGARLEHLVLLKATHDPQRRGF